MNDSTKAVLLLVAAGVVLFTGWKLMARPGTKALRKAKRVACLGDSLTHAGLYCGDLAAYVGASAKAFGYEGQGTGAIGSHVDDVLDWSPEAVVVLAGVNDLRSHSGAQTAISGLTKIYAKIHEAGLPVVAVEILPWHGYFDAKGWEENTRIVNTWIRREANVEAFVRTSSMGNSEGRLLPEYDDGSHLHLNRAGQGELASLIAEQAFGR